MERRGLEKGGSENGNQWGSYLHLPGVLGEGRLQGFMGVTLAEIFTSSGF